MKKQVSTISIQRVIWKYLSLILFLALAGVGLATSLAVRFIHEDEIVHESFQRNVLSKDFSELIGFYRGIARSLSTKHELRDIVEFNDVDNAVLWAKNVRGMLPEAIGAALINKDGDVLGEPLQLSLGKQCVIDLRRLLDGDEIAQPAVHTDVPHMSHFDIIQPVKSSDELMGLLFMSFSLEVLQRRANLLVEEGQFLLIENTAGTIIADVGELHDEYPGGFDHVRVEIPDTDWYLHYMTRHGEANQLFTIAVLIGIVILVITIMLTLFFSGRLVSFFHNDLQLIRRKLNGVHTGSSDHETVQDETRLLETAEIMQDVSSMVDKIELANEQLKFLSMNDPLTGLLNRRAFYESLTHHINLANRGFPAYLALLDLDLVKEVNDRYGHNVGDEVLVALAVSLRERCRNTDILARFGGDEFVLIMPGGSINSIDEWYRRVNALFRQKQSQLNHGQGIEPACSISAGAIQIEPSVQYETKELMEQVDSSLYEAKGSGRATICYK